MKGLAPRLAASVLLGLIPGAGALWASALPVAAAEPSGGRCDSLKVLEGRVASVGEAPGEGDLQVVTVRLEGSDRDLLLAPSVVLDELDFPVEEGDLLRLRVVGAEEPGPARVHRVLNLTRSRMVRLRTMQQDPLWDGSGHWQGSPGGHRDDKGGGRRHRGGNSQGSQGGQRGGGG